MPSTDSVSHQDLVACTCEEHAYTARDAIDAAIFRGEFEDKWQKFLHHVAAEERADELELELDESAISAVAEEFRYQHDLITAEETEAWLASRGLTLDDFSDYFARQYCASAVPEGFCPEEVGYNSADPELRELFVAEVILSGDLEEMTTKLMWRLAARCAGAELTPDAVAAEERSFFERNAITRAELGEWLERLGRDTGWFNDMLVFEATYCRCCETLLLPKARQRELATLRMALTRLETEVIELESRDAAQEALFCIREDGMSMEEVAAEGRYPYRRVDFVLEDIATEAQQRFLGVSAGCFLEPLARGDGFELCRIISKIEPQADDPTVRSHIDQRLLDRHFSELTSKYVEQRLGGLSSSAE
jgi:hypothetical protein